MRTMAICVFSLMKTGGEEGIEEFNFITNLHFTIPLPLNKLSSIAAAVLQTTLFLEAYWKYLNLSFSHCHMIDKAINYIFENVVERDMSTPLAAWSLSALVHACPLSWL